MDYIFIDELTISIRIGCSKEERAAPQPVRFSLKIFLPLSEASKTGRMSSTVDYADIINRIKAYCDKKEYVLIEMLANEVAMLVLADERARAVQVDASKQILSDVKRTGVSIYREKT